MSIGIFFTILLVGVLFLIMLGLGMSLTTSDFARVLKQPKAALLGLCGQILVMPLVALALALFFPLNPEIAIGMLIVSVCPGGPTSNALSHLAKGDTALSISLTALSSTITPFTIPMFLNFILWVFAKETGEVMGFPIGRSFVQMIVVTIIPISIGMLIRAKKPAFCARMDKPVRKTATAFLGLIIAMLIVRDRNMFIANMHEAGVMVFVYGFAAIFAATLLGALGRLSRQHRLTIGIEVGIQNCLFAILIASSPTMLNNEHLAVFPAMYGAFTYLTVIAFIWGFRRWWPLEPALESA